MKVTFLGTGTSHGIPVIGCNCDVCQSDNPKNNRTRSSVWIQTDTASLLIDTANEFRLQAIRAKIAQVDGVLYTHCHADHVFGFDDLRIFSQYTKKPIPVFGNQWTIEEMSQVFNYVFRKTQKGGGKPQVELNIVGESQFFVNQLPITPIPIHHGVLEILGYRINNFAYLTDCSYIPEASFSLLEKLDVLVLGMIRYQPHPTHLHLDGALRLVERIRPKRCYFTHCSHYIDHDKVNPLLPAGVKLAYDGLEIKL